MNAGGAETYLMKIYRDIDRSSYQMDFCINVKEKCFYEDEINSLGGKIFRIPSRTENYSQHKRQLFAIVKENGYKYVFSISSNATSIIDLIISKRAGAQICSLRSSNSSGIGNRLFRFAHIASRVLLMRYVDRKIAPSTPAALSMYGKKAIDNGEVIFLPNAIDLNVYKYSGLNREKIRKECGIRDDQFVIGHIGRFNTQKNHQFLIDVFFKYHEKNNNAVLFLVGEGTLIDQIREKVMDLGISESVIFAGTKRNIPAILSAMDFFLFPSLFEGMPNTVIEAQASGLVCLISDTITKEANISGNVYYYSLEENSSKWADQIEICRSGERYDATEDFLKHGYNIENCIRKFISVVFE